MYKNNPTSEATIKETATSIVEVFEKYLLSIDAIVPCSDIEEEQERKEDGNQNTGTLLAKWKTGSECSQQCVTLTHLEQTTLFPEWLHVMPFLTSIIFLRKKPLKSINQQKCRTKKLLTTFRTF